VSEPETVVPETLVDRTAVPKTVLVFNGANLNLLGQREPSVYGSATLADVEAACVAAGRRRGVAVECRQTNHEGQLLEWVHDAGRRHAAGEVIGAVINPGAWTHTSIALRDAVAGAALPVVECHISNVHAREDFRHTSYLSAVAAGVVVGFGVDGYLLGIDGLLFRAGLLEGAAVGEHPDADESAPNEYGPGMA